MTSLKILSLNTVRLEVWATTYGSGGGHNSVHSTPAKTCVRTKQKQAVQQMETCALGTAPLLVNGQQQDYSDDFCDAELTTSVPCVHIPSSS